MTHRLTPAEPAAIERLRAMLDCLTSTAWLGNVLAGALRRRPRPLARALSRGEREPASGPGVGAT